MTTKTTLLTIATLAGGLALFTGCKKTENHYETAPAQPQRTDVHIHDDRPADANNGEPKNIHVDHADNVNNQ